MSKNYSKTEKEFTTFVITFKFLTNKPKAKKPVTKKSVTDKPKPKKTVTDIKTFGVNVVSLKTIINEIVGNIPLEVPTLKSSISEQENGVFCFAFYDEMNSFFKTPLSNKNAVILLHSNGTGTKSARQIYFINTTIEKELILPFTQLSLISKKVGASFTADLKSKVDTTCPMIKKLTVSNFDLLQKYHLPLYDP